MIMPDQLRIMPSKEDTLCTVKSKLRGYMKYYVVAVLTHSIPSLSDNVFAGGGRINGAQQWRSIRFETSTTVPEIQ